MSSLQEQYPMTFIDFDISVPQYVPVTVLCLILIFLSIKLLFRDLPKGRISFGPFSYGINTVSRKLSRSLHHRLQERQSEKITDLQQLLDDRTRALTKFALKMKNLNMLLVNHIELLEEKHGRDEELDMIEQYLNRTGQDIGNLLEFEKMERGKSPYHHHQVSHFSDILKNCVVQFENSPMANWVPINSNIEENIPIRCDPMALVKVINNILDNAIKFSDNNQPIYVGLHAMENGAYFMVKDSGIGIPQSELERIFLPYVQVGQSWNSDTGIGTGLALVKQIVNRIDGTIEVHSSPGQGTEFIITFPKCSMDVDEGPTTFKTTKMMGNSNLDDIVMDIITDAERPTVMIVDGNVQLLRIMSTQLSDKYNILVASDGKAAIQKLQKNVPLDLVISELDLGEISGFDLYNYISSGKEDYRHVPFIILTAESNEESMMTGLEMGVIDYLEKPLKIEFLKKRIEAYLTNLTKQKQSVIKRLWASINRDGTLEVPREKILSQRRDRCREMGFTDREIQISEMIITGKTVKEIALELFIAENTVKVHTRHIYEKAKVRNRIALKSLLERNLDH